MDKTALLEKVKSGSYTKEQLASWIGCLQLSASPQRKPVENKRGDVYMHTVFKHPCVLLKKKKNYWLCGLLTTEPTCTEILEPTQSRFFSNSFFTRTLFTIAEPDGTWMNTYENNKHLTEVLHKLQTIML